jgi:ATP-dependent RNA helicase DeaD
LRERLAAGDFDDVRAVVTSLAAEFDILDIAAAAVKVAHLASSSEGDDETIPAVATVGRTDGARASRSASHRSRAAGPVVRLFIGAGRTAGVRPGDLVGAITGETGIESGSLGSIQVAASFSIVEVPEEHADRIIAAVSASGIRGKRVAVRRDRNT